jgi:flagellar protein FlaG
MELGIQGRMNQPPIQNKSQQSAVQSIEQGQNEAIKETATRAKKMQQQAMSRRQAISKEEIDRYIRKVLKDASLLNKDLRYSINKETNVLIVKVVDKSTDKVIKEIPPEALQRLQARLKEQLGLFVD